MNIKRSQGFIAWCVLITTNTTIICLGLYATALAHEYYERSVYMYEKFTVEQKLISCTEIALRAIAGRSYVSTSTVLMDTCRILSSTPLYLQNGSIKIEVFSSLYASTTVINYRLDEITGILTRIF